MSSQAGLYSDQGRERTQEMVGRVKSKTRSVQPPTTIEEIEAAAADDAKSVSDVCELLFRGRRIAAKHPSINLRYRRVLSGVAKRLREVRASDLVCLWMILSDLGYRDRAAMPLGEQLVYDRLVQSSLLRARKRAFNTQDIAKTLSAMAKLNSISAVLSLALLASADKKLNTIKPQDIAMMLHAASRLGLKGPVLEKCFAESLGPHIVKVVHTFNPQDLSMCLLAIAVLELPFERVEGLLPGPYQALLYQSPAFTSPAQSLFSGLFITKYYDRFVPSGDCGGTQIQATGAHLYA
jgi:hypothetical protein